MADEPLGKTQTLKPGAARLLLSLDALRLRVVAGPDAAKEGSVVLPAVRLGTAPDNDFVLTDPTVSRYHAEIQKTDAGLLLKDLDSTNGTHIGDVRVAAAYLEVGRECRLGDTCLTVEEDRQECEVEGLSDESRLGSLLGGSEAMRRLFGTLRSVAKLPVTVLVTGESGTGKELVAQTLHELSGRNGPLVVFDAAAVDKDMVRADLFGHVKGAFTGAGNERAGRFREAHKGTLFLDEIGELPLDLQPRLLRVLEAREVTPVGADRAVPVDVRVVAATHRDVEGMVADGEFREDLYHRLSVIRVKVPALRERPADIPLIADHLLEKVSPGRRLTDAAREHLAGHSWPGNVRALRNVLARAAAMTPGTELGPADLELPTVRPRRGAAPEPAAAPATPARPPTLEEAERQAIEEALARNEGNKSAAARELDMPLSTLKRRLKAYEDADADAEA